VANLTAKQVIAFVRVTQDRYRVIDHEDWDGRFYRTSDTAKWQQAAAEAVPNEHREWRDLVRVLAQGECYYSGSY
jgi:hypothetical protein